MKVRNIFIFFIFSSISILAKDQSRPYFIGIVDKSIKKQKLLKNNFFILNRTSKHPASSEGLVLEPPIREEIFRIHNLGNNLRSWDHFQKDLLLDDAFSLTRDKFLNEYHERLKGEEEKLKSLYQYIQENYK